MRTPTTVVLTVICGLLLPNLGARAEGIVTAGPLSDGDLYRLVACGAKPGMKCAERLTRWSQAKRKDLRVKIVKTAKSYPLKTAEEIGKALNHAITEVNAAGAGVRMRRVTSGKAEIHVHLVAAGDNEVIRGTRTGLDGSRMEAARMLVNWRTSNGTITDGAIAIGQSIMSEDIPSVVLEELVQCLGLTFDILNPTYTHTSIFAEDGNDVTALAGQDVAIMRLHHAR
jgi:Protein of unknown function (DUF2927)